jgi:hypothetical protein
MSGGSPHLRPDARRRARRALALVALVVAAGAAAPARADVVDDWNIAASDIITGAAPGGAGLVPPTTASRLAIVNLALYDAAVAIDGRYRPYHAHPNVPRGASFDAAVAVAGHDTLVGLFPAFAADLAGRLATSLAPIPDGQSKTDGMAVGAAVAADLLALRANDGWGIDDPSYYVQPPAAAGVWLPLSGRGFFPWVSHVTPFTLRSPDQFLSDPPPALTSRHYARAYNEVQELGRFDSATRTPEQTNLALFFADNALRMWNRTVRGIAAEQGIAPADKARLYAEINTAGADALSGCWAGKYHYQLWRPEAAITTSFDDGNKRTTTDPTWKPLRGTPNYADYPSGHACFTGSVMDVLRHWFGRDKFTFTVQSIQPAESPATGLIQPTLVFHRFSEVTDAVQDARMLLGIHFRFAMVAGDQLARETTHWMLRHAFQPVRCREGHGDDGGDD